MSTAQRPELERWGIDGLALGISLGGATNAVDLQRGLEWAEWADTHGLHSVWMPEMHFTAGGNTSPLLYLAAYAARTERIRLATTSVLLPIHHPIRIAREVAALDHLSLGRVILGLGRGFRAPLFAAFGIDPATKRRRFDESLDLMLASWRGESVSLDGTCFADERGPSEFAPAVPYQRPAPPLAVAAFGQKGLAQAARRGLPYLASPMEPFELIRSNLAYHRERLPEPFDAERHVAPVMRTVYVTDDDAHARRVIEALAAESRIPRSGVKLPAAIARAVEAPLTDRVVVGSAAEVTDRLARYREELGTNLFIVRPMLREVPTQAARESLHRLTEEILPSLSG